MLRLRRTAIGFGLRLQVLIDRQDQGARSLIEAAIPAISSCYPVAPSGSSGDRDHSDALAAIAGTRSHLPVLRNCGRADLFDAATNQDFLVDVKGAQIDQLLKIRNVLFRPFGCLP